MREMVEPDRRLMSKVCHAYYRRQRTQAEIGAQFGLSRHKVGRILKQALASGFVRIHIDPGFEDTAAFEDRLEQAFGLKSAIVVAPEQDSDEAETKQLVAQAAAEYLRELIRDGDAIGVGWGSTTLELVRAFRPMELSRVRVVQVTGGNKLISPQFDCHEVTRQLAEKLDVEPTLLHAPGIVDRPETRRLLLQESSIAETFRLYAHLRVAVVGIGSLVPRPSSTLLDSGYVTEEERARLLEAGAVGDVFSYFVDAQGVPVPAGFNERLITIGQEDIRSIPYSIGVATGAAKAQAVCAAVRGGFVNVLVVDRSLAEAMLGQGRGDAPA